MFTLEVCANSVESAINAQKGGANRIELCENLYVGGTTPSFGCIAETLNQLNIPVHVLIRPRPGDFVYSEMEFRQMLRDIEACKKLGVKGVVSGILRANGTLDKERTKELVWAAKPMTFTFHRAFDIMPEPFKALNEIIECGCNFLLTSGQKNKAVDGLDLIRQLIAEGGNKIALIAGGGINHSNILELAQNGVNQFHMSGSEIVARYNTNHTGLSFVSALLPENTVQQTNAETIASTVAKLKQYFNKK
ncbi:copper homeostasis protein CutC [Tenuifilum sp.]|uniref:copper homeostasis protein CutC n=1 Tax=Tenuifilum sp. TaxID=2760880 RepID=UPI002B571B39|nr:copper homeostasis protein CutC [Tenuifilum sp.]HOK84719.1 copper homeostasis protein CutC [Tenuifilum sp.]HON69761.1 copper homeostasis protein CutC [Tenuifilum sp.]HPP88970.1 copper homeostasis protein CutC [Tenuifilum sp.]